MRLKIDPREEDPGRSSSDNKTFAADYAFWTSGRTRETGSASFRVVPIQWVATQVVSEVPSSHGFCN